MPKELIPPKLTPIEIHVHNNGRFDCKNAAIYIGVSEKTLAMWRTNGTSPPFTKIGHHVFYYQSDLDAWLSETPRFTSTAQARLKRRINNA